VARGTKRERKKKEEERGRKWGKGKENEKGGLGLYIWRSRKQKRQLISGNRQPRKRRKLVIHGYTQPSTYLLRNPYLYSSNSARWCLSRLISFPSGIHLPSDGPSFASRKCIHLRIIPMRALASHNKCTYSAKFSIVKHCITRITLLNETAIIIASAQFDVGPS